MQRSVLAVRRARLLLRRISVNAIVHGSAATLPWRATAQRRRVAAAGRSSAITRLPAAGAAQRMTIVLISAFDAHACAVHCAQGDTRWLSPQRTGHTRHPVPAAIDLRSRALTPAVGGGPWRCWRRGLVQAAVGSGRALAPALGGRPACALPPGLSGRHNPISFLTSMACPVIATAERRHSASSVCASCPKAGQGGCCLRRESDRVTDTIESLLVGALVVWVCDWGGRSDVACWGSSG